MRMFDIISKKNIMNHCQKKKLIMLLMIYQWHNSGLSDVGTSYGDIF